jgi:hypothetical protein
MLCLQYRRFGLLEPLRIGPIVCPETPATDYQSTLRNIPEESESPIRNLHSTEIKRGLFTEKERCALKLLRKYTEALTL